MDKGSELIQRAEREARRVLQLFEQEIRALEDNLAHLRKTAAHWASAVTTRGSGRGKSYKGTPGRKAKAPRARVRRGPTMDWDKILARLPKSFSREDLKKTTPSLNGTPKARVMALARWVRGKQIKKVGDGKYQRV